MTQRKSNLYFDGKTFCVGEKLTHLQSMTLLSFYVKIKAEGKLTHKEDNKIRTE